MSTRWERRLQYAAVCLLVVAYAGLSHYCNSVGANTLGAALALAPLTLVTLAIAWRWTPPLAALLLSAGFAAILYRLWPLLELNFSLVYLAQESGVYGLLGLTFSRSLMQNRIAVCTRIADKVHGPLAPREVLYTRRVTAAWAAFFYLIATISALLFLYAPLRIWSLFINFCVLPLVGAMFLAEFLVRRRVLPHASGGLLAAVRAYFACPQ